MLHRWREIKVGMIEIWARKLSTALLICLALQSCISQNLSNWPATIPQQQLFIRAYEGDLQNQPRQSQQEYLEWILSFYKGSLVYQDGWLDIEAMVLLNAATKDRQALHTGLAQLGLIIATEWAKDNEIRLIDSQMLALWGSILQLATSTEQQVLSINTIEQDVMDLLSGGLQGEDIQESRYAATLGIDLFGDF